MGRIANTAFKARGKLSAKQKHSKPDNNLRTQWALKKLPLQHPKNANEETLINRYEAAKQFWQGHVFATGEEAKNRPNVPLQEKFDRGILRGLRKISDTP